MATFSQHHVDGMDLALNPLQIMMKAYPNLKEQEARAHLGSFGVSGPLALQLLYTLSGGQKSRVALAKVIMAGRPTGGVTSSSLLVCRVCGMSCCWFSLIVNCHCFWFWQCIWYNAMQWAWTFRQLLPYAGRLQTRGSVTWSTVLSCLPYMMINMLRDKTHISKGLTLHRFPCCCHS